VSLSLAFRQHFGAQGIDIAFDAPTPGTTVLFGPSGAGKSTAIAALAGLLRPERARIVLDGVVLADTEAGRFIPPERRRIGLVFQDARLFPHMSVTRNLRYGQRPAPADQSPGAPHAPGFDEVVDLLGIRLLLDRRPGTLSGGERQRVAIGRALLSRPRMLAMDEPLASLDAARKAEILPYLARLKSLGLPILYVTHSAEEMASLADTLVLIEAGRVTAAGPVAAVLTRADLKIAAGEDAAAILAVTVEAHDPARQLTLVRAGGQPVLVPQFDAAPGVRLRLRVPAREVILAGEVPRAISVQNVLSGSVRAIASDAERHLSLIEVALDPATPEGPALLARVTPDAVARLALAPGKPVLALVKSVAIQVLPG
jgi:molybdate transport system ATP-binding protein